MFGDWVRLILENWRYIHIFRGYYMDIILNYPNVSDTTLTDMGKWIAWIQQELFEQNEGSRTKPYAYFLHYSLQQGNVHCQETYYNDVIMGVIASQITSLTSVYSTIYSGVDQRKHQSSALLAFVRGIHRGPVNFPHNWPVTRKMFSFDDVIMRKDTLKPLKVVNFDSLQHLQRRQYCGASVSVHNRDEVHISLH